jgi:hypothetical protein
MLNGKDKWLSIALINLAIVALLGVVLRSKILFSIPGIDFKNILHAHSHFAFGGWITLCLLILMTYEILPEKCYSKQKYRWLLTGILFNAVGMLLSFPIQGYAFFSILFSTLFIFVTYAFSWVFISDLIKYGSSKPVKLLCITALVSLSLSSVGPFTLAYMLATHSVNTLLYKDAIYTYLHLQYNGFFTLSVFALLIHKFYTSFSVAAKSTVARFAAALSLSVLPTLFLSYLWHFQSALIRSIAIAGCVLLVVTLYQFVLMLKYIDASTETMQPFAKKIGFLSMIAFALKTAVQTGIVFPAIGNEVFGDRPIIIGYLHLVMLGFITLYLLAHLVQAGYFEITGIPKSGIILFTCAVIANEVVLMTQGLAAMLMVSSAMYPWLLFGAAICLFTGAALIARSGIIHLGRKSS